MYYSIINKLSRVRIERNEADFRLLDSKVVRVLQDMRERSRFLRGLINWVGFSKTSIPFVANRRATGTTKYTILRMVRFALDGITSFSSTPLRLGIYVGMILSLFSFAFGVLAIYQRFYLDSVVPGWVSIVASISFLGGMQLITTGIMGLYVARMYEELKERPLYIVNQSLNFESPAAIIQNGSVRNHISEPVNYNS